MTFEAFQSTRRWADDLRPIIGTDNLGGDAPGPLPGFHYHGQLHIFAHGGDAPLTFELVIANIIEVSADLGALERRLYAWGVAEGAFR